MKKQQIVQLLIAGATIALGSCETDEILLPPSSGPGPGHSTGHQASGAKYWHDKGFLLGEADAHEERSDNWRRHISRLTDDRYRDEFIDGYSEGYEEHSDSHASRDSDIRSNNNTLMNRSAYTDGYSQGFTDNKRGLSRNPARHDPPPQYRATWDSGYKDGWSGNPRRY